MDRMFPPLGRVFMLFHFELISPFPRSGLVVVGQPLTFPHSKFRKEREI